MKRLRKFAEEELEMQGLPEETDPTQNNNQPNQNVNIVNDLLQRINSSSEDIKSSYYSLLENLNALNKDFPGVYNELKVMVKLPNKNEINSISQFKSDMEQAITMLSDETFLSGLVK